MNFGAVLYESKDRVAATTLNQVVSRTAIHKRQKKDPAEWRGLYAKPALTGLDL